MNENLKKSRLDLPRVLGIFCLFSLFSLFSLLLVLFLTIPNQAIALDKFFPNDCPDSAQACVDQICAAGGGTLHVAEGRHTLGPGTGPEGQIFNNNLFAEHCPNFELKGEGVDKTTLDASGSRFVFVPGLGTIQGPFMVFGQFPFTVSFPLLENIKISDLTIEAGSDFGFVAIALTGIGMGSKAHDLKIVGFSAISVTSSEDFQIYDNVMEGTGVTSGAGIDLDANCSLFRVPGGGCFPPANLHQNLKIANNHIINYRFGILADHLVDSKIEGNLIENCNRGITILGGKDVSLKENSIKKMNPIPGIAAAAGILLRSFDDGIIKANLICEVNQGNSIRFVTSAASSAFLEILDWPELFTPGSGDNLIKDGIHLGYATDRCGGDLTVTSPDGVCFDRLPVGQVSDEGGNHTKGLVADSSGMCP